MFHAHQLLNRPIFGIFFHKPDESEHPLLMVLNSQPGEGNHLGRLKARSPVRDNEPCHAVFHLKRCAHRDDLQTMTYWQEGDYGYVCHQRC